MLVQIISIGDELLIGQTVNTNAAWMGQQLRLLGVNVDKCHVIKDDADEIRSAVAQACEVSDVVLITGGLGPTKDDITKEVLCDIFEGKLVSNQKVLDHVRLFFEKRNREMLEVNIQQAMVPDVCEVLHNEFGTAPGMLFRDHENKKVIVSMPGVPYEMKYLMSEHVLPLLEREYETKKLFYRTVLTQGIGESYVADRIEDIENGLRSNGVALAYLPSPGGVRLRMTCESSKDQVERLAKAVESLNELLPQYIYGEGDITLEEVVGQLLKERGHTVCTIESCTGGSVGAALTSISGSSEYVEGGLVTYSNEAKNKLANVSMETIQKYGAVSKEVVEAMAIGGRERLGTDYSIALTGIAGPNGGTEEKPVGTVWIAIAGNERVLSKKFQFENNRSRNIRRSVLTALNLLRCEILQINIEKS
jgi:nicotinamide-nucleotide amidase